jgi:hypothetical protein
VPSNFGGQPRGVLMKRTLICLALLVVTGTANAGLSFSVLDAGVARTEAFNSITGLPTYAVGTTLDLGTLMNDETGTITFTYLGAESAFDDKFFLTVNGTHLYESDGVGSSVSAFIGTTGAVDFKFEGDTGKFAVNGGTWDTGTSIGRIAATTVDSGAGAGTYDFIIGYDDSAGRSHTGDWDDFVVGVKFTSAVPEPETYAMLLAGLGLMGFVARRRRQKQVA